MPQRETNLRSIVTEALLPLDAIAVENPALPGTPDVNYVEGWIELKSHSSWPKRPGTAIKIPHWTPEQRVWHVRRSRAGGRTFVLLEVVKTSDYLLLEGAEAARILGRATRAELEIVAIARWRGRRELVAGLLPLLRNPPSRGQNPDPRT